MHIRFEGHSRLHDPRFSLTVDESEEGVRELMQLGDSATNRIQMPDGNEAWFRIWDIRMEGDTLCFILIRATPLH